MKIATMQAAVGSAIVLLSSPVLATINHRHQHLHNHRLSRDHSHSSSSLDNSEKYSARNATELRKRGGKTCQFPSDKGLVAVTPGGKNGGWAMAPDQECVSGTWCPIACPSGQVMNQWKPDSTYTFPDSTYGGLYCNDDGEIEMPFSDKPCCVDGTGTVEAVNKCGDVVSFCQTVLPGYEDMLIPTDVIDTTTIAVPSKEYWAGTSAHYYINAPGVGAAEGCVWGDSNKPIGNWAPYVAGANTVADGSTYVKVGINPVWESSSLYGTKPNFGLEIECPNNDCNGIPCKVDGNGIVSNNAASGAGGAAFCVVTVPKGSKANIVVSFLDGSGGGSTSSAPVESTTVPTTSSAPPTTSTSSPTPTSTSTTSSTPSSTSSSTPPSTSTSSSSTPPSTSSSPSSSSAAYSTSSSTTSSDSFPGGVFQENRTSSSSEGTSSTTTSGPVDISTSDAEPAPSETNENAGSNHGGTSMAGLIVALVAASYLL